MSWERVLLPDIKSAREFASRLEACGVSVRFAETAGLFAGSPTYRPELLLVGGSVSVEFAVHTMQMAIEYWPTIQFVLLTCDEPHFEPEERHYEVFVGAPLLKSRRRECLEWSHADWQQLNRQMRLPEFHSFIRNYYATASNPHTRADFVGGPRDGDCTYFFGSPEDQPQLFFVRDPATQAVWRYEREEGDNAIRYRFMERHSDDAD